MKNRTKAGASVMHKSSAHCGHDLWLRTRLIRRPRPAQQLAQLGVAGCAKIYQEKVSGGTAERPQLKRAVGALDAGDVLMVTSTDRLARNTRDLLNILHAAKVADVVVNNAGVTGFEAGMAPHDPEHASLADWRDVHRVNLDGAFLGCRYAIGAMKAAGAGSIINISSRSGLVGIPAAAAYALSKAAIRNHSKTVALYCSQQGWKIRCKLIHPAAILTPIWEPMLGSSPDRGAKMQALVADTPLKRFGMPDEVAAIAVMLASDEATYVTGTEVNIDGGLLAGSAASPG